MKPLYITAILLISCKLDNLQGQIINVENARKTTDTTGLAGGASVMGSYFNNTNAVWNIKTATDIQWKTDKKIYYFLTDWTMLKTDQTDLQNLLYLHLRYNYKFNQRWRLESFLQYQYNKIQLINNRILSGIGPRIKLLENETSKIYFGSLLMAEWEDQDDEIDDWVYHTRLSNYLSFTIGQSDVFSFRSTTYYQPSLHLWKNFRIHNEEKFEFYMTEILSLISTLRYSYDRFPVLDAPKFTFQMVFGLKFSF
ncbi:DUF481 domain-containing protein [Membranihabitans marinus]|uniref:DUF481 domain-containing protein n=1 Tax=Membranihabitans marinus TaxID=1227546 RepID=UPI001F3EA9C9|nr:DUF481 domain-containing protein [Membranihabitans marinus]